MLLNGIRVFAGVTLSGLAIGLPVGLLTRGKGTPMLNARSGNSGSSLGFRIASDQPAGGGKANKGLKVGQKVRFSNDLEIKFGKHTLKSGDKLCSPDQDYNFFLMKKSGTGYVVEGNSGIQMTCRKYLKNSKLETVRLEGMRGSQVLKGSLSVGSIELSTCSFELTKTEVDNRYRITISDCRTNLGRNAERVISAYWEADYK